MKNLLFLSVLILGQSAFAEQLSIYNCKAMDDGDPHGSFLVLGIETVASEGDDENVVLHVMSDYHGALASAPQAP